MNSRSLGRTGERVSLLGLDIEPKLKIARFRLARNFVPA